MVPASMVRSHEASDLDLMLRGPDLKRIPSGQLADLTEALEQSNVPIHCADT